MRWLAHLYAFVKVGTTKVGGHSVSFASASKVAYLTPSSCANQSVEAKIKNVGAGSMSPHLYKNRKGGPATNTASGATSSNSRFIDGSDETDVNGSGSMFGGTQGRFNSNCGGSCEAKGSLFDLPGHAGAVANAEQMIGKTFEDNLNFFGGHGKSTSYRTGEDQLTHLVVHAGGATEIHFEGHPPGRDLMNFVLHQVDAIRDSANHQSSKEPKLP